MNLLRGLSWAAIILAVGHAAIGVTMAVAGNPDGWIGGVFYVAVYAVPLLLVALALRGHASLWRKVAGWAALAIAAYETLILAGNWTGYSAAQAVFVTAITVPTALLYALIFWAVIVRHPADAATLGRSAS
jgi:hypothetical protein